MPSGLFSFFCWSCTGCGRGWGATKSPLLSSATAPPLWLERWLPCQLCPGAAGNTCTLVTRILSDRASLLIACVSKRKNFIESRCRQEVVYLLKLGQEWWIIHSTKHVLNTISVSDKEQGIGQFLWGRKKILSLPWGRLYDHLANIYCPFSPCFLAPLTWDVTT